MKSAWRDCDHYWDQGGPGGRQRYFNKQLKHPLSSWHLRYLGLGHFSSRQMEALPRGFHPYWADTEDCFVHFKKNCVAQLQPLPRSWSWRWSQSQTRPGSLVVPWCGRLCWLGMLNNCFHREAISHYDPLIDSVSCLAIIMLSTKRGDNVITRYKSEQCLTHY